MSARSGPRRHIRGPGWLALLAEVLRDTPKLPGAACSQHVELFDFDGFAGEFTTDRAAEAIRVCWRCPALEPCRAWVDGLPVSHRPRGVVAARWQSRGHPAHISRRGDQ